MTDELARLDARIGELGRFEGLEAREELARAAIEKGRLLADELDQPALAIEAFDLALSACEASSPTLKVCAADGLFWKSQALFDLDRPDEALASIKDLTARFDTAAEGPDLRFSVCHALYVTAFTLRHMRLGRDKTILAIVDQMLALFGDDADRLVRDRILHAMIEKSFALERLGRREAGVALRNAFAARYAGEPDPEIRAHADRVIAAMDERFAVSETEKVDPHRSVPLSSPP